MKNYDYKVFLQLKESQDALKNIIEKHFSSCREFSIERTHLLYISHAYRITTEEGWEMVYILNCIDDYNGSRLYNIKTPDGIVFKFCDSDFYSWDDAIILGIKRFFWLGAVSSFMRRIHKLVKDYEKVEAIKEKDKKLKTAEEANQKGLKILIEKT